MHEAFEHEEPAEGAMLQTMALLSTLSTAAGVRRAMRERRAGRDPSGQEEARVARPSLYVARDELLGLLMRLQAGLVHSLHGDERHTAVLVRRFDELITLGRAALLLQEIHQRLLSLYPEVSEMIVEEVRALQTHCRRVEEAEDAAFLEALGAFLESSFLFTTRMQRELMQDR